MGTRPAFPSPRHPSRPRGPLPHRFFGRQQEEPMGKKGPVHIASSSHRTQTPSTHAPKRAAGFPLNATDFPTKAFVLSLIFAKSSSSSNRNTEHVNMTEKMRVEHTRDGSFANCRRPDANGPYKPTRSHTAFAHRLSDIAGTTEDESPRRAPSSDSSVFRREERTASRRSYSTRSIIP